MCRELGYSRSFMSCLYFVLSEESHILHHGESKKYGLIFTLLC